MLAEPEPPPCAIHVSSGEEVDIFTHRDGRQDHAINIRDIFARLDRSTSRL